MIREQYRVADVSPTDYATMTGSEKIRHHQISAADLRRQAGPMFRAGVHIERHLMPREWHDRIAEAERHEATAERLLGMSRGENKDMARAMAAQFRAMPDPAKRAAKSCDLPPVQAELVSAISEELRSMVWPSVTPTRG